MSKAAQIASVSRSEEASIGKQRRESAAAGPALPASAALFLVVIDSERLDQPYLELEFGSSGKPGKTYARHLSQWLREEWRRLSLPEDGGLGFFLMEGYARYASKGFPGADAANHRTGIARALQAVVIEKLEPPPATFGAERDSMVRVTHGPKNLVDRFAELWKGQATQQNSSSGMWNQMLVPSSRSDEEPAMHVESKERHPALLSAEEVHDRIRDLNDRVSHAQKALSTELQSLLNDLVGRSFGSLEANQDVADGLRFLMQRLEVRVACPKKGCGKPALLRARRAGRSPEGTFGFEHTVGSRIMAHAASTRMPDLRLVPAPPDRRRKVSSRR